MYRHGSDHGNDRDRASDRENGHDHESVHDHHGSVRDYYVG